MPHFLDRGTNASGHFAAEAVRSSVEFFCVKFYKSGDIPAGMLKSPGVLVNAFCSSRVHWRPTGDQRRETTRRRTWTMLVKVAVE